MNTSDNKVFSKAWFEDNQMALVWLFNQSLVRLLFKSFILSTSPIVRIMPNAIKYSDGTINIWTWDKVAFRLHSKLNVIWKLLHFWDLNIANRMFKGRFNAGFDTFYPQPSATATTAVSGWLQNKDNAPVNSTWAQMRAGTRDTLVTDYTGVGSIAVHIESTTADNWRRLYRGFINFDTSTLTSAFDIDSAELRLTPQAVYYSPSYWTISDTNAQFKLVTYNATTTATLTALDFFNVNSTSLSDSENKFKSMVADVAETWELNTNGLAAINKTGVTSLAIMLRTDFDNTVLTPASGLPADANRNYGANFYSADNTGVDKDPMLTVIEAVAENKIRTQFI